MMNEKIAELKSYSKYLLILRGSAKKLVFCVRCRTLSFDFSTLAFASLITKKNEEEIYNYSLYTYTCIIQNYNNTSRISKCKNEVEVRFSSFLQ